MKTLSVIKQEAREEFKRRYKESYAYVFTDAVLEEGNEWFESQLDELADRLVNEIEKAVVPEKPKFAKNMVEPGKTWWEGWLMNRAKVIEAFIRFKGESV